MKNMCFRLTICLLLALVAQNTMAETQRRSGYFQAIEHVKSLPDPPTGFKWAVNPDFTDEFEGSQLNAEKWYDKSPYWKNGRPPATFKAYNVSKDLRLVSIRANEKPVNKLQDVITQRSVQHELMLEPCDVRMLLCIEK